jgi:flagellar biosynthesis protein
MKRKKAIALRYEHSVDPAPVVVAKGEGILAERILEIAKEHDVPIKHDPVLAGLLIKVPLEGEIPPELYRAVAEVLVFIYQRSKAE